METRKNELIQLLEKISNQTAVVTSSNNPSALDIDLLRDYVKQFYECLNLKDAVKSNGVEENHSLKNQPVFEVKQVVSNEEPTTTINQPSILQKIVEKQATDLVSPTEEKPVEQIVAQENKNSHTDSQNNFSKYKSVGEGFSEQPSYLSKITNEKTDVAVADKLKISPLTDLNDAIGINERFAYANVFMNGDINTFYSMLAQLNSKTSFEEAYNHFKLSVIDKFNVDKNNKAYREFIELLQRRFAK